MFGRILMQRATLLWCLIWKVKKSDKVGLGVHLTPSLASSIILLNSSFACIILFFFSFLSSSARVFTY